MGHRDPPAWKLSRSRYGPTWTRGRILQRELRHFDPDFDSFNPATGFVVPTTKLVATRTNYVVATTWLVAARTKLVAERTNYVVATTWLVAARTKFVGGTTSHVAGRTKLVATRTKPFAGRAKPSFASTAAAAHRSAGADRSA